MANNDLIRTEAQLKEIADAMSNEVSSSSENVVSRYTRVVTDVVNFLDGQETSHSYGQSTFNRENMESGIYSSTPVSDLRPHNVQDLIVARDLNDHRFNFCPKGIDIPTLEEVHFEGIPDNFRMYDDEFREFTERHPDTTLARNLTVEQKIVVNSKGGVAIQSIPSLGIFYSHGYSPIPTNRDISVVCSSNEDVGRLPDLIKFIADPTPNGRIKSAETFSDAFHQLHKISGLKYGSLEEAGIPLSGLYDVVVLTGVPIHEIFGHQFEEPIRFLDFGESGTFKFGQSIQNKDLVLSDNPGQTIEGFRVQGFTYFDAYGRERQERVHIKDGKVVGFLGSEYADPGKLKQYLGLERSLFVGNSTQHNDGHFPQPRMSCTVLDGKTEDVDLEGKLLIVPHEGHTNPQDKTYMVKANECYVVQDGVPRRVIPLQVTGGINQALSNLVLIGTQSYQTGTCQKPEPIYYPQSRGMAAAQVSQFTKSQLWQGQQVYPLPITDAHLRILQEGKN